MKVFLMAPAVISAMLLLAAGWGTDRSTSVTIASSLLLASDEACPDMTGHWCGGTGDQCPTFHFGYESVDADTPPELIIHGRQIKQLPFVVCSSIAGATDNDCGHYHRSVLCSEDPWQ
ncbi:MAG: hypothetical protein KA020_00635 [Planctomycetes bacterium]|jgi:hypothetical protein|nr:hypothetical protein [Planctomycetota bacterium]